MNLSPKVRSAILIAADSVKQIRPCDAWRVCDKAFELSVLTEVEKALEKENSAAHAAFCEYRDEEYGGVIAFAKSHSK